MKLRRLAKKHYERMHRAELEKEKRQADFFQANPQEVQKLLAQRCVQDSFVLEYHSGGQEGSYLGGVSGLPEETVPRNPEGKPLDLLACIDCAELPGGSALPESGRLYFFFDINGIGRYRWGQFPEDAGYFKVIYVPGEAVEGTRGQGGFAVKFSSEQTAANGADETGIGAFAEEIENSDRNRLLGFPCALSSDHNRRAALCSRMTAAPPDTEWVMLLQLASYESEDNPRMDWEMGGILFYWIPAEDLRNLRFDRVWAILECF